jgi:hypothetical protein
MSDSLMSVPVYYRNSAKARDILTRVPSEDIGREDIRCVMKFLVKDAFWKEQRLSSGMHRPYLELNGEVQELFIEPDDDRLFPCGSKSLTMDEPQDIRIAWIFNTNQLANLVQKGIYYNDFEPPEGLIDGIIEIPTDVTYTCVYDTPISMVTVARPFEVVTDSRVNHYDDFVDLFQVSAQRAREETLSELKFETFDPSMAPAPESPIKDYFDDDVPSVTQEVYIPQNLTDEEALIESFNAQIQENEIQKAKERQEAEQKTAKRKAALNFMRAKHKADKEAAAKKASADMDLYKQLMGSKDDSTEGNGDKLKYDAIKDGVQSNEYAMLMNDTASASGDESKFSPKEKWKKDAEKSLAAYMTADRAHDLLAYISGNIDAIAGGASTDTTISALKKPTDDITGAQDAISNQIGAEGASNLIALLKEGYWSATEASLPPEEKKRMQEKKIRFAVMNADIVHDLEAFNSGNLDAIAGGSSTTVHKSDAQTQAARAAEAKNALANLLGGNKSTPEAQGPGSNYI